MIMAKSSLQSHTLAFASTLHCHCPHPPPLNYFWMRIFSAALGMFATPGHQSFPTHHPIFSFLITIRGACAPYLLIQNDTFWKYARWTRACFSSGRLN